MATRTKIRTFTDLDPSFEPNPNSGDLTLRRDERAIKFAIRNLILTNYYERPFRSFIGSPINELLFANAGSNFNAILKRSIEDVIRNFEPRVVIKSVDVYDNPDNNSVDVSITFSIVNTEKPIELDLTLKRTR